MSQTVVYINPRGETRSNVSYSARQDFRHCKRYFQLTRIDGWKLKQQNASMLFGRAVESAVQYHIENSGKGGPQNFIDCWEKVKTVKGFADLKYTAKEKDWESLLRAGTEMLTIFAARLPNLPIPLDGKRPQFQVPLTKEIFPNSRLAGVNNVAYVDLLAYPEGEPLIIDIKTAGTDLKTHLLGLDAQLIEYAWQTGVNHVGFLWFVKHGHGLKAGDRVTTLEEFNYLPSGSEIFVLTIFEYDDKPPAVLTGASQAAEEYEKAIQGSDGKTLRGKSLVEAKLKFTENGKNIWLVPPSSLSKQRVQFATIRLNQSDILDVGKTIGLTTVEMISAHETGFYPREPGIRFPHAKCPTCNMRYICSDDTKGRDENLVRAGEEWLEEMGDQDGD